MIPIKDFGARTFQKVLKPVISLINENTQLMQVQIKNRQIKIFQFYKGLKSTIKTKSFLQELLIN